MADPQIDLVKIRNAELARRGLGAAQGISDFAAPVRDTLYSGIANPLAYLKDMSLAGLSGIYGAASDISGFGASALGAPELGKQLFSKADEGYGSAMTRLKGALPGVPDISGFGPQDMTDIFNDENLGIPAFDVKMPATDRSGKVSSSAGALGSKVIPSNVQGGRGKDPRAQIAKDKTEIEKLMGINNDNASAGINDNASAGIVQTPEVSKVPDAADELYKSSYEEYMKGFLTPDVAADPDSLEKYKQEFAKATGLDVSGKADTSQALIAFGLAAMQNRAGKGFNVGRMLESLGQAGEKALPALDKARADATAARLAAGKYALTQRQSDIDAKLSSAAAAKDFKQQVYLKWYDSSLKREEDNLKAEADLLKVAAENSGSDYGKKHEFEFATGQTSFKIPVVYDEKSPSAGVILKPDAYARKYIDGRAGVEDALDVISTMRGASQAIAEGGGTVKFAYDRMNSIAKAIFPDLNVGKASSEQEYAQGVNLIMGRFKRFLTQETGNGISNKDVQIWENEIMKKPTWFTNFDETSSALNQLEDIFRSKLGEFDAGIDFIYDEGNLLPGDYKRLVEKYGDVSQIQGKAGKLVFKDGRIVRSQ
jgi:hypothetical protein